MISFIGRSCSILRGYEIGADGDVDVDVQRSAVAAVHHQEIAINLLGGEVILPC